MGQYLLVDHDPDRSASRALWLQLRAKAQRASLSVEDLSPCLWLAVAGPCRPRTLAVGPWTLIGDVFNRGQATRLTVDDRGREDYERKLFGRFWGRFIGLRTDTRGRLSAVLRDPSGALDCMAWEQDGLTLVASEPAAWLMEALRPAWRIDYGRLARALRDPLMATGKPPLHGPTAILPGTLQPLPLDRPAQTLWTPAGTARHSHSRCMTAGEAGLLLRTSVDEAVKGLASLSDGLAAEVSGGLDSSIVAASLVRQGLGPVQLWLNGYGETPQSDERAYVAALAQTLGLTVTSVPLTVATVTRAGLERISQGWRPGLNALDPDHDLDWARRVQGARAGAIMTGKGGDSVLMQTATTDVFTDRWQSNGWTTLFSGDMRALSTLNEVSIWSMVAEARRYGREGPRPMIQDGGLLVPLETPAPQHPWLEDCAAFGPARRFQIAGVTDNVSRHAPSLQTHAIDVLNPLCAQPVVEACLAIPAPLMTLGGRDRGLARHVFSDRLPRLITDRRSKGNLTGHYGRRIHASLEVLRPWLLDGRLMSAGLLDRTATQTLLTRESLMWRGHSAEIMVAAAFEGWLRAWEPRLSKPQRTRAPPTGSRPAS
jgi:asparagine synthase (glutamine-hydrolysing)